MSVYLLNVAKRPPDPGGLVMNEVSDATPMPVTVLGPGAVAITIADNAPFTDGTSLVTPVGFIYDEVAGTALSENDTGAARMDAKRSQVIVIEDATTRGQRLVVNADGSINHISQGISKQVAVTTSGAGYVSGDVVGGIISITTVNTATGRPVRLQSLTITDKNGNAGAFEFYFFKATPASGTYTDNGAIAWGSGDAANCVGTLAVATGDWLTSDSQSFVNYAGIGEQMPVNTTTLFVIIVAKGSYTLTNGNFQFDAEFQGA